MAELRQNMATKEWVIIADERAKRPSAYIEVQKPVITETQLFHDPDCPFCPGNEELDLEVERFPLSGKWQTRVVRNRYPALSQVGSVSRTFDGVHRSITGVGYHEVVVEHRRHNTTLALMKAEEINDFLQIMYSRGWEMQTDNRIEQVVYFKNHGQRAGASLRHPHSQIIGLPVVPNNIRRRIEEARRYFDDTGYCVYCTMVQDELKNRVRIVDESEHFVAFVLYAAPAPFHMWILPRRHSVSFLYILEEELADLSAMVRSVLRRLYIGLRDPSYNLIIRSAPSKEIGNDYLHWYITIVPRFSRSAGFELGSGIFINPAIPEESAAFLRQVEI
jgi:UDPglucose--hexose-1-phosphate uridylyltransferase